MSSNKKITVALAGNPNCGKSTIFNNLTGSNQHVGNYPGVTVEKKEGVKNYKGYKISFVDLPGTYSLSAYSEDEVVARDFIINGRPDVVIDVVDASNMDRNLYLFTQLAELDVPVMIVLNMADILKSKGYKADDVRMSSLLGVPVISTIGTKKSSAGHILDMLTQNCENGSFNKQKIARVDYGSDIKEETEKLAALIAKDESLSKFPLKWLCIKLLDDDASALEKISASKNADALLVQIQKSRRHIQEHFNETAETKIAEYRYGFTKSVVETVVKEEQNNKKDITALIDKFVLNRILGLPIFAAVMYLIFKFTFAASEPVVKIFESFFNRFGGFVAASVPAGPLQSLLVDGIIGGVGGVLGFFPLVLFMFFAIAFFEDTGYMARAAFVMDGIMSRFGLHGKSFLPMMISTNGCAVPGFMAARTLDSKRDRFITMFAVSFMICGAKLPVFSLFIGAFFAESQQANIMFVFYILSVIIALAVAKVLSKTVLKGEPAHFVMELPPYHMPTLKGLLLKMWERGWLYIKKAGTIIVLISILIWAGFTYPKSPENAGISEEEAAAVQMERSFLGRFGQILEPAVKPIGMDGKRAIALVAGLAAKEVVVSTLGTIYSLGEVDPEEAEPLKEKISADPEWSPLKAFTFLIFCLIYIPCIAAVAVFFKESGSSYKWLTLLVAGNTIMAWAAAFIVFQLGTLLKIGTGG
ncbi:MAG: ferrous iron transport protein B [Elusimicrobiota bacterium]|jgi:ferrous iron transport protein B|nr:ferrous iron transport protein B [Elusimicrobiota bacterium]